MATTTRVLDANVNGTVYTSNANDALEALDTCHAGATAPTDEVANGKLWLDTSTTPGVLKIYDDATWSTVNTTPSASEILTLVKTVDGAGSGLDADLLDGNSAAAFYLATNPDGYTTNVGTITTVTAGGGISGGGASGEVTIDHADTSAQASVNNSGSVYIQDITLDTYGHVTAIASTTVPSSAPSSSQVGSATSGLAVNAVGTYAYLVVPTSADDVARARGSTLAGSSLRYSSGNGSSGVSASGTWRLMGQIAKSTSTAANSSCWLRIS